MILHIHSCVRKRLKRRAHRLKMKKKNIFYQPSYVHRGICFVLGPPLYNPAVPITVKQHFRTISSNIHTHCWKLIFSARNACLNPKCNYCSWMVWRTQPKHTHVYIFGQTLNVYCSGWWLCSTAAQNDFHFNVRQQSMRERESEKKMYKNTISNRH